MTATYLVRNPPAGYRPVEGRRQRVLIDRRRAGDDDRLRLRSEQRRRQRAQLLADGEPGPVGTEPVKANALLAIIGVRFHIGNGLQCTLEFLPIEEPCPRLDVLAVSKMASEQGRYKLINGHVIPCGQLGRLVVQILRNRDVLAHIPSRFILLASVPKPFASATQSNDTCSKNR